MILNTLGEKTQEIEMEKLLIMFGNS